MKIPDLYIADFGLSRTLEDAIKDQHTVYGTPGYLDPEILNNNNYTMASDIFSTGCIIFKMLAGRSIFSAESVLDTIIKNKKCDLS